MTSEQIAISDALHEQGRADALAGRPEARHELAYGAGYDAGWSQRIQFRRIPHGERQPAHGHAANDADMCPGEACGYYCTRPAGHLGQHEAGTGTGPNSAIVAVWNQS